MRNWGHTLNVRIFPTLNIGITVSKSFRILIFILNAARFTLMIRSIFIHNGLFTKKCQEKMNIGISLSVVDSVQRLPPIAKPHELLHGICVLFTPAEYVMITLINNFEIHCNLIVFSESRFHCNLIVFSESKFHCNLIVFSKSKGTTYWEIFCYSIELNADNSYKINWSKQVVFLKVVYLKCSCNVFPCYMQ